MLGCSEEKEPICCSLKPDQPTLLPGETKGLAASSTHRLVQPGPAPQSTHGGNPSSPNLFCLTYDGLHPSPFTSQSRQISTLPPAPQALRVTSPRSFTAELGHPKCQEVWHGERLGRADQFKAKLCPELLHARKNGVQGWERIPYEEPGLSLLAAEQSVRHCQKPAEK